MNVRRMTLLSLLAVFAFGLLAPVSALASGPSAGDQQYVDPLGGGSGGKSNGGGSSSGSSGSSSSGSSSSGSSSSGAASSGSSGSSGSTGTLSASSAATSTAAAPSTGTSSTGTLPYTGFDTSAAIALGIVLIGTGFVLRRRSLRA